MDIIEKPDSACIVDSSGWPAERLITIENKYEFIQLLLCEELLTKRMDGLRNLREGLNYFGLVDLFKAAPNFGEVLFLSQGNADLSAKHFLKCFELQDPTKPEELKAYNHVIAFVNECEKVTGQQL